MAGGLTRVFVKAVGCCNFLTGPVKLPPSASYDERRGPAVL